MEKLFKFYDDCGSFTSKSAIHLKSLYFPLGNEALFSSVSPDLHGDIKTGQDSFLMPPVSRIDLTLSRASRNFWIYIDKNKIWSASGVSKEAGQIKEDRVILDAGLLWHKITRENKRMGLRAEILSFVPASGEPVEIMQVKITNISRKKINFIPTAAIPLYARSATTIRDHRHVTSLLARITLNKFGVVVKPTLLFDEAGHECNNASYFVFAFDPLSNGPRYIYPTQEMFCGEEGDLEAPKSVLENLAPSEMPIQGKEPMAALGFGKKSLASQKSVSYIVVMGITERSDEIKSIINKFNSVKKVKESFSETKEAWIKKSRQITLASGERNFDDWFSWVAIQPVLRKIFGCSFLPDFDYGKGGRGWRDLWQDCLGLILSNPHSVRSLLINNFSGLRIDGSNATIITNKNGGFIADRNDIARVWMDHGIWPLLTLDLYINETGDYGILFEEAAYFCDRHIFRSNALNKNWNPRRGNYLKESSGRIYKGSIFEHLLLQNLTQFFNVGRHNHIRLEGADWNDGLDMAGREGESVAFTSMYAQNLKTLADLLIKSGQRNIPLIKELKLLLGKIDYDNPVEKVKMLKRYFQKVQSSVSGAKVTLNSAELAEDLKDKSEWISRHIRKTEWLREGFFNGYYDNKSRRVEGLRAGVMRMMFTSQVMPIMSAVASNVQVDMALAKVRKYLRDKKFGGYRLNTDFREEQLDLGRAFSFTYGEKENGAFFNHMTVMFAYALYKRNYAEDGWEVLNSIYNMAIDTGVSKIYPCLPEYFNSEGRGMYSYLTGSASWFVLTLLTQAFGVRGLAGDLLIEPKLSRGQFRNSAKLSLRRSFAGREIEVTFSNPKKLKAGRYGIIKASLNSQELSLEEYNFLIIPRKRILALSPDKVHKISIILG
ncbi:MAG: cellobiose phosphorylase [Candidatus Omnitrophota bacterium]|jgi:cellobiose phosphorylase